MVRLEITYIKSARTGRIMFLPLNLDRQDGLGWAYHLVMAITSRHALLERWNTRKLWREQKRLAEAINQTQKAYARGGMRVRKLTEGCPARQAISLLVRNGWRIRKVAGNKANILESN